MCFRINCRELPDIPLNLKQPRARERATRTVLFLYQKFGGEWFDYSQVDRETFARLRNRYFPHYVKIGVLDVEPHRDRAQYKYRIKEDVIAALKKAGF